MIKALGSLRIQGTHLSVTKTICSKPRASIVISGENLESCLLTSGTRQGGLTLPTLVQKSWGSRQKKERKLIQIGKGEVKGCFSLFLKVSNMKKIEVKLLKVSPMSGYVPAHLITDNAKVSIIPAKQGFWACFLPVLTGTHARLSTKHTRFEEGVYEVPILLSDEGKPPMQGTVSLSGRGFAYVTWNTCCRGQCEECLSWQWDSAASPLKTYPTKYCSVL